MITVGHKRMQSQLGPNLINQTLPGMIHKIRLNCADMVQTLFLCTDSSWRVVVEPHLCGSTLSRYSLNLVDPVKACLLSNDKVQGAILFQTFMMSFSKLFLL